MAKWSPNYDVNEVFGTRIENWTLGTPNARVTLQVDMDKRYLAMADIVGEHRIYPFDTPTPLYANSGIIRLDKAKKTSSDDPDEGLQRYLAGYEAFLDITYMDWENLWWNNPGNIRPFADKLEHGEVFEPSMQFLTDDYKKFGWSSDPVSSPMDMTDPRPFDGKDDILKRDEEPGKPFYQVTITRTVMGYNFLPVGYTEDSQGEVTGEVSFEKWPGYVHSKDFKSDFTGIDYPAGTLLFTQPQVSYGVYRLAYLGSDFVGIGATYKITAKLIYQENGWNAFYRSKCANNEDQRGWYPMVYLGCEPSQGFRTAYNPYEYLDMSQFIFGSLTPPRVVDTSSP